MQPSLVSFTGLLLPAVVLLHLYWAPYTKVEESFNIQAVHDIITFGVPFRNTTLRFQSDYDHFTFTGPIPRTFVGALTLARLTQPFKSLVKTPEQLQSIARGILGLFNGLALMAFQDAINQAYGKTASFWFVLLQSSQFHVMYYASRTLPNMFAFGFTTLSLRYMILSKFGTRLKRARQTRVALFLLTSCGIIFRSELAILLAVHVVVLVLVRRTSVQDVIIPAGALAFIIALTVTVAIDSFFWQSFPLWPELVAFKFNTIDGKASEWGESPWYFYFVNSLPRLLLNPLSFLLGIPIALYIPATRKISLEILAPLVSFVAIYSLLPHKEWRFIIYTIPGFTGVASTGAAWIWTRRSKSLIYRLLAMLLMGSVLASFVASCGLLALSTLNYPGAEALHRLHHITHNESSSVTVHLDNLSCQTGVTRFLQKPTPSTELGTKSEAVWIYDKTEDPALLMDPLFWQQFDYVLTETPERAMGNWDIVEVVKGYAGIAITKDVDSHIEQPFQPFARTSMGITANSISQKAVQFIRTRITRSHWPRLKMEPKIMILKKHENQRRPTMT